MSHAAPPPRGRQPTAIAVLVVGLLVVATLGVWWAQSSASDPSRQTDRSGATPGPREDPTGPSATDAESTHNPARPSGDPERTSGARRVVVVSIDGLGSAWVTPELAPTLTALLENGAGTLNARTEYEMTVTLPNHTGMVTGRRVEAARGGHGVTWNVQTTQTVRPGVESVFTSIADAGGTERGLLGQGQVRDVGAPHGPATSPTWRSRAHRERSSRRPWNRWGRTTN